MVRVASKSIDRTNATTFTFPSFFFIFPLSRFFIAYHETGIERLFLSFLVNFLLQRNDSPRRFLMSLRSCHFPSLFHSFVSIHLRFLFLLIDPRFVSSLSLLIFLGLRVRKIWPDLCWFRDNTLHYRTFHDAKRHDRKLSRKRVSFCSPRIHCHSSNAPFISASVNPFFVRREHRSNRIIYLVSPCIVV